MLVLLGNNLSQSFRDHFNARAADPTSGIEILPASIGNYRSTECYSELFPESGTDYAANKQKLAGRPVTILQSTAANANENSFKLLLLIRTLKRHGAGAVTVAMPFAAFARQDREFDDRFCSVHGDDFAFLLKAAGADRIVTAEVHSKKSEDYYVRHFGAGNVRFIAFDQLYADDIKAHAADAAQILIGGPDGADKPNDSGQRRAHDAGKAVWGLAANDTIPDHRLFKIWKTHTGVNETKVTRFEGAIAGRDAVIVDDMSDSGGTAMHAGEVLKNNGATSTAAYLAHGLFNEQAIEALLTGRAANGSHALDTIVVADTVPEMAEKLNALAPKYPHIHDRIRILPTAPLFERTLRQFSP